MSKMFGLARIGRDAEIRFTPGGEAVAGLSLAFTYRVKGEKCTQWVDGSLWGKRAEALAPYLIDQPKIRQPVHPARDVLVTLSLGAAHGAIEWPACFACD